MPRLREQLNSGALDNALETLYPGKTAPARARFGAALDAFEPAYGQREDAAFYSSPGRSEICGNHTDHQLGRVLAATVTLDMLAVAAPRSDGMICIHSAGYAPMRLSLCDLAPVLCERETSAALVRGVAADLKRRGYQIGGFDAVMTSGVPKGSGLSSSAAYSILVATIINSLYNESKITPVEQALAAKQAENRYFGKPSGLMDQLACASGGFVEIDFHDAENPIVERISCDLTKMGYAICIVNAGGSHANLTDEYASIPKEMELVAAAFGKRYLSEVEEDAFYARLGALRGCVSDRALLRAMHFFAENKRVSAAANALKAHDAAGFMDALGQSGQSSFCCLQNVCPADEGERSLALALALSARLLGENGAWRVHGGGFAGTIQAIVPIKALDSYCAEMERTFGAGCCYRLSVRPVGGVRIG